MPKLVATVFIVGEGAFQLVNYVSLGSFTLPLWISLPQRNSILVHLILHFFLFSFEVPQCHIYIACLRALS